MRSIDRGRTGKHVKYSDDFRSEGGREVIREAYTEKNVFSWLFKDAVSIGVILRRII
jgi:hypothetical protein